MPRQRDAHRTVTSDKKSYQNQILVILVVRFLASTSREQRTKQTVQNCFSETPRFRELVKYVTLSYITFKIVKDRSLDQNCLHNSSSQLRRTVWGLYGARCGNVSATVHTREKRVLHHELQLLYPVYTSGNTTELPVSAQPNLLGKQKLTKILVEFRKKSAQPIQLRFQRSKP